MEIVLPDIGTLSLTLSAFRILYKDKATTWGHQNMSFVSQLHVTDVILHLQTNKKKTMYNTYNINVCCKIRNQNRCTQRNCSKPLREGVFLHDFSFAQIKNMLSSIFNRKHLITFQFFFYTHFILHALYKLMYFFNLFIFSDKFRV